VPDALSRAINDRSRIWAVNNRGVVSALLDSRAGARVVSRVSHLPGSTGGRGPMRSTKGSALDPTQANGSASSPPPVRPSLHFASAPVLLGHHRIRYSLDTPPPLARRNNRSGRCGNSSSIRMSEHRDLQPCPEPRRQGRAQPGRFPGGHPLPRG